MDSTFDDHLRSGSTTLCRAWKVARRDGAVLGFTDHDQDLSFEGVVFLARTGMTARALQQTTGMAVDNTEAMGALSDVSVREDDIQAGRFDGAEVTAYLVNWQDVSQRQVQFTGNFGEITRTNGIFQVELRGLSERLNRPIGRVYHAECSAALGDRRCGIDLADPAYAVTVPVGQVEGGRVFGFAPLPAYAPRWFDRGQLKVMDGAGRDQGGLIKTDRLLGDMRVIELWQAFSTHPQPGDMLRLEVGCDKRGDTCGIKFGNFLNFRGFPHIPGEDWLRAVPRAKGRG